MSKTKNRHKQLVDQHPIESITSDFGSGIYDLLGDFAKQTKLAPEHNKEYKTKGELAEGEELVLSESKKGAKREIEAGEIATEYIREIVHGKDRATQEQTQEISEKLYQIKAELKQLIDASKELQVAYKEVSVEQRVTKPGKYHESFFEWLLSTVRTARIKVEDSAAWLSVFKSKKAKRDFWAMAKSHGTSFSLSNERTTIAMQPG